MNKPSLSATNCAPEPSVIDAIAVNPECPWLDVQGNTIDDVRLKVICKAWNPEMWERYLSWLDEPRSETLVGPRAYEGACDNQEQSIFEFAQSSADDDTKDRIAGYLAKLSEQQRRVIQMTFWEGRSERYIADHLKISHTAVHNLKRRAFKKISGLLRKGVAISRIMKGKVDSAPSSDPSDSNVLVLTRTYQSKAG